MAGGPVGRWGGIAQPVLIETGGGDLLSTAVAEQNIAEAEDGHVARSDGPVVQMLRAQGRWREDENRA